MSGVAGEFGLDGGCWIAVKTLLNAALIGCSAHPLLEADGGVEPREATLTVMSYNLANEGEGDKGRTIAGHIQATEPDFVAAQECLGCDWFLNALDGRYGKTTGIIGGVAVLYEMSTWVLVDEGVVWLGINDDGWGDRVATWGRFLHQADGRDVYVYSTHWCVTIRRPDDACTVARHLEYADTMLDHVAGRDAPDSPVVLAGDFNVFDDFEDGPVVAHFLDAGYVDVFRVADPDGDGTTFQGNHWAPPGRIDYIFASQPVQVIDAYVDRESVPDGQGSDHYAVVGTIRFEDTTP